MFYSAKLRSHVLVQDIDLSRPDSQDRIVQMESPSEWGFRDLENSGCRKRAAQALD